MGELAKHTTSGTIGAKDVGEAVQELISTMNQVAVRFMVKFTEQARMGLLFFWIRS